MPTYRKRVTAAIFAYGCDNQRLLDAVTGEAAMTVAATSSTAAGSTTRVAMAQVAPALAGAGQGYLQPPPRQWRASPCAKRSGQSLQRNGRPQSGYAGRRHPAQRAACWPRPSRPAPAVPRRSPAWLAHPDQCSTRPLPPTCSARRWTLQPGDSDHSKPSGHQRLQPAKASQPRPGGDLLASPEHRNNHGRSAKRSAIWTQAQRRRRSNRGRL